MRKWGIALAIAGLLAAGAQAGDLNFVPVNTSQNLAAPVPMVFGPMVQKKTMLGRAGDKLKSLSPFSSKKTLATPPGPTMPTTAPGQKLLARASALLSPTGGISGAAK
jgi:hypothetical protein